ncbi:MAG: hypothetical protein ACKO2N_06370 [Tabrizicola sp.]
MTSESKILTVSYGTFSCTLEGFENPFDTMKAIAEYFRDLAAQDRHFGAEPPPPDAAMLHRLAEREVSRLAAAAAQRDDTPRAEALAEAAAAEPAVTPRILLNQVARRQSTEPGMTDFVVEEPAAAPEPSVQDVIPDGVAAKLARIRRAVNPAAADLTSPASPFVAESMDPDLDLGAALDATAAAADLSDHLDSLDADTPDVAARLGALIADDDSADLSAVSMADDAEAAAVAASDPWADRLETVATAAAEDLAEDYSPFVEAEEEPAFAEADLDMSLAAETSADSEDLADLAALDGLGLDQVELDDLEALDGLDQDEPSLADLEALDATDADAAALAALDAPQLLDEPAFADSEISLAPQEPADALTLASDADAVEPGYAEATVAEAEVAVADTPAALDAIEPEPEIPVAKSNKRSRRLGSRVVRLHPSEDLDAADRDPGATRVMASESESDEIARLMQQAEEVMAEEANRRRQEALSHLKNAVATTEADRADLDYDAPRADVNLDPYRDDLAEAIQPDEPVSPEAASEVKPTRRKSVNIRPQEPRPGTIRPGMISPPPLVLVSEQRVDRVGPAVATPVAEPLVSPPQPGIAPARPDDQPMVAVRTGRLSGAIGAGAALAMSAAPARNIALEKPSYGPATNADEDEDLAEDSREIDESGLAAFAENVGAKSMAEMLEAAAAYATCIEKREQFTRPQLMRRMMASAGGKPVSREDGLRSFGTLLRTGRIEKVTRGHYSLADTSPYLAEARRLT